MKKEIANLIETWAARPAALAPINDAVLTPDNERDLLYLYSRLLPALVDAMPGIIALNDPTDATQPTRPLVPGVSLQGSDVGQVTEPAPAPSTRIPTEIQKTDGTAATTDPIVGTVGKSEALPAIVTEIVQPAVPAKVPAIDKRIEALRKARAAKIKKQNDALREVPQEIVPNAPV
jgi:hypothetical protein